MDLTKLEKIKLLANRMRHRALKMAYDSGNTGSHLGGGLSAIEIFATLYGGILNIDSENPVCKDRDRLIVSKGHCVLAYYTALNEMGFLNNKELENFEVNGAGLHGHATRDIQKGVEFSGGSLGLGMSYAIGVALAGKLTQNPFRVFAIIGDGECNEGIIWEAFMSAAHFNLDNLTVIVDNNKLQYDGMTTKIMNMGNLKNKIESFGFHVDEIDGHDVSQLFATLKNRVETKAQCIIAHTIKGKGVSFMENNREWHHSKLTKEQFERALAEQPTLTSEGINVTI